MYARLFLLFCNVHAPVVASYLGVPRSSAGECKFSAREFDPARFSRPFRKTPTRRFLFVYVYSSKSHGKLADRDPKARSPTILASPFCELIPEINVLTSFSNNYRFNVAHRSPTVAIERGKTKREKTKEKKRNRGSRRNARVSEHWQARTRTIPHIRERKIVVLS